MNRVGSGLMRKHVFDFHFATIHGMLQYYEVIKVTASWCFQYFSNFIFSEPATTQETIMCHRVTPLYRTDISSIGYGYSTAITRHRSSKIDSTKSTMLVTPTSLFKQSINNVSSIFWFFNRSFNIVAVPDTYFHNWSVDRVRSSP